MVEKKHLITFRFYSPPIGAFNAFEDTPPLAVRLFILREICAYPIMPFSVIRSENRKQLITNQGGGSNDQ